MRTRKQKGKEGIRQKGERQTVIFFTSLEKVKKAATMVTDAQDVAGMHRRLVDVLSDEEVARIGASGWLSRPLRIVSACSGTDAPIMALEHVLQALTDRDGQALSPNAKMDHVFSCENVPFKRSFIASTTKPPLLFNDVTEIAEGKGKCHDGKVREVPESFDVLIAGTECVDFSNLTTTPKGLRGGGRSAITFWATVDLAELRQPPLVILENVASCPAKEMEQAFRDIGYDAVHTKLCTSDYLLPQSRRRAYFVFCHRDKAQFIGDDGEAWVECMERLGSKRKALPKEKALEWTDFLVSDVDTLYSKNKGKKPRGKSLNESLGAKWLAEITSIEEKEGLTAYDDNGGRPYSDATKGIDALALLPDRAKMRLDVQCKRAQKAGIDPFQVPLLWNPAQQLRFTDAGFTKDEGNAKSIAPCITPKHEWIVSSRKAPFTGEEALLLQGISLKPYGAKLLKKFDDKQLRDLAGNAMSVPVVAAVFLSCFLNCELIGTKSDDAKRMSSADTSGGSDNKRMRLAV